MEREIFIDNLGHKYWYTNGELHREDGPAVEFSVGTKHWYKYGLFHRDNGPAVEHKDYKQWWQNGKLHREEGPAIEYANGDKSWYYNDKKINVSSQQEFEYFLRFKSFW